MVPKFKEGDTVLCCKGCKFKKGYSNKRRINKFAIKKGRFYKVVDLGRTDPDTNKPSIGVIDDFGSTHYFDFSNFKSSRYSKLSVINQSL